MTCTDFSPRGLAVDRAQLVARATAPAERHQTGQQPAPWNLILFGRLLGALLELVNAPPSFGRIRRVGISQQHFIVVNPRPLPHLALLVELGDGEVAAGLLSP